MLRPYVMMTCGQTNKNVKSSEIKLKMMRSFFTWWLRYQEKFRRGGWWRYNIIRGLLYTSIKKATLLKYKSVLYIIGTLANTLFPNILYKKKYQNPIKLRIFNKPYPPFGINACDDNSGVSICILGVLLVIIDLSFILLFFINP